MAKGIPHRSRGAITIAQLDLKLSNLEKTLAKNKLADEIKYKSLENFTTLLAAFAGHDIKNAIHNMDGVVSLLSVDTVTEEDIQLIKECATRLRDSLDEFTNIGLPQDKDNIEAFEVGRLMSSIDTLHRQGMKHKGVIYKTIFITNKNTLVKQNFHWLVQTMNNLLINATTALKDTLDKRIQVTLSCEDEHVTILISDTGAGILPENKKKVFEPYFTTTGGSGIGLAHVKSVMKQIKGRVELVEAEGFNTTIKVTFPQACDTPS